MLDEKKLNIVMKGLGDYLSDYIEKNMPVTIAFQKYGLSFAVYGTQNRGMLQVSYKGPGELRLQLGVLREGTDRLYSHYLPIRSPEEMIRYLRDPASHADWMNSVRNLSDSVDDYWD